MGGDLENVRVGSTGGVFQDWSRVEAAPQLLVVVCPHTLNFSRGVQQHYLGGLATANIVDVVDDDRLCTPQRINQIEAEIRIGLNTPEKVISQRSLSSHRAIAIQ